MAIKGDLHSLGLGIIEQITREVDKDCNTTGTFETIKPACESIIKDIFPQQHIEVHPVAYVGIRLLHRLVTGVDKQTVSLAKELEAPKNDR